MGKEKGLVFHLGERVLLQNPLDSRHYAACLDFCFLSV